MNKTRYITRLGMLLAVSVLLNIIESEIPLPIAVPGVKLGLANTIGLILIYFFGAKEYFAISFLRILLVALLRTGFGSAFLISGSGMLLSVIAVLYFRFVFNPSIYGLSIVSAMFHGVGQILMVGILYKELMMIFYLPILLFSGIITGYLVAYIGANLLRRMQHYQF